MNLTKEKTMFLFLYKQQKNIFIALETTTKHVHTI